MGEAAVREIKSKMRSFAQQVGEKLGKDLTDDHPCLPWMAAWAATSINLVRRCLDGRTAWEDKHGRAFHRDVGWFGETLLFMRIGPKQCR